MTSNLINYWRFNEDRRHNQASEAHNANVLEETKRHNLATEAYNSASLAESSRHNLAVESETHRSNVARETETHRANVAYETESHRHNLAVESESHRHNVTTERETERSNRANEALKAESNQIGWANVSLGKAQLAEQSRHNKAQESITSAYNNAMVEQRRIESNRSLALAEKQQDIDRAKLEESKRHNLATEGLAEDRFIADVIYDGVDAGIDIFKEIIPWS